MRPSVGGRRDARTRRRARRTGLAVLVIVAVLGAFYGVFVAGPLGRLDREEIEALLASESPVFYADGRTPMGVFFDGEHRRYVPWEEIPATFRVALVAAEDARFWTHPGFDLAHIGRAAAENWRAGEVVAGGSTLTQQTAKNLFGRDDRSLWSKLVELVRALRLEAWFDKTDILTFYANQFHVTGNGRGLGIAARYFFDKEARDLTLTEAAFVAGLLKAPARFDPFRRDRDERERALALARERTRYVLERVVEVPAERLAGPVPGWFASDTARAAWEDRIVQVRDLQAEARRLLDEGFDLDFKRGSFRWAPTAVLDEVARRLAEPPFDAVLEAAGVVDPARAGLQIVTTIDQAAQRAAEYALVHHLTEVGVPLEGLDASAFALTDGSRPWIDPNRELHPRDVRVGVVEQHDGGRILLDLGGRPCTVDEAGVQRAADAVRRGELGSLTARAGEATRAAVRKALPAGTLVLVSVRDVRGDDAVCDLEVRPSLQGAAVVIEDGRIRAMVGGSDNRFFNRATALRQMGSAWKPIVMHAALQLGWSPEDLLDNRPQVFRFSTTSYAPEQAHRAPPVVTLAWAATRSENVASVWLLHHLTDHLSHTETARLAEALGLAREKGESEEEYRRRIERLGVVVRDPQESLYNRARQRVLARLRHARHPLDATVLASLDFDGARGSLATLERLRGERVAAGDPEADLEVDGLHASTLAQLEAEMDRDVTAEDLRRGKVGRYDPEILYWNRDFRLLLGMRYVTRLAAQYGVRTKLAEVQSMPLGGSELTLEELAMVYDGMSSGETWRFRGRSVLGPTPETPASTLLIQEIRDRTGRVIYRAEGVPVRVASPAVGAMTRDLLRNVVEHGTGRRASGAVSLGGRPLPLAGKTGTTNEHRNAAFVGYAPKVTDRGIEDVFTVGVYVGHDLNAPMRRRGIALQGSNGALPAWILLVQGLAEGGVLGPPDVKAPAGGWRWPDPPGTERIAVTTTDAGWPLAGETGATVLTRPVAGGRRLEPVRTFEDRPDRPALSTRDAETWTRMLEERASEGQAYDLWSPWAEQTRQRLAREAAPAAPQPAPTDDGDGQPEPETTPPAEEPAADRPAPEPPPSRPEPRRASERPPRRPAEPGTVPGLPGRGWERIGEPVVLEAPPRSVREAAEQRRPKPVERPSGEPAERDGPGREEREPRPRPPRDPGEDEVTSPG